MPISDASQVFSQQEGTVEFDKGALSLELSHAVDQDGFLGRVVISDPQIFDKTSQLITSPAQLGETYSNSGKLDGVRTVQNRNTQAFIIKEHYVDGKKQGEYAAFDNDGNKETFGTYHQGVKDGDWVEKDGNRIWRGTYSRGDKEGRWLGYNTQGYVVFDLHYKNGKLNGPQYAFADNGALTLFEERAKGVRNGKRMVYKNGIKTGETVYKDDEKQQ